MPGGGDHPPDPRGHRVDPGDQLSPLRSRLALRGALWAAAAVAVGAGVLLALTLNVLQRQQAWCDDCPDLPADVYASDDRYFVVVLALGALAVLAVAVATGLAVARRSRRALRVGAIVAGALLAAAVAATALHWVLH